MSKGKKMASIKIHKGKKKFGIVCPLCGFHRILEFTGKYEIVKGEDLTEASRANMAEELGDLTIVQPEYSWYGCCPRCGKWMFTCDAPLTKILSVLNSNGFLTGFSCIGHYQPTIQTDDNDNLIPDVVRETTHPYVSFKKLDIVRSQMIEKVVEESGAKAFESLLAKRLKVMGIEPGLVDGKLYITHDPRYNGEEVITIRAGFDHDNYFEIINGFFKPMCGKLKHPEELMDMISASFVSTLVIIASELATEIAKLQ